VSVRIQRDGGVWTVVLDRPEVRNAVDTEHAQQLLAAFEAFEADDEALVAVLWGAGGTFCAGADLRAVAEDTMRAEPPGQGPPAMGPTRLALSKPVIAAVEGYAVAGGLELAVWCDLRIADPGATFGVFCRRWDVPLIDGGTVRLPRIVGLGRALDLVLTGRAVSAAEALAIGLVNRISPPAAVLAEAQALASELAALPQICLRSDRASTYEQAGLPLDAAIANEWRHGMGALRSEAAAGARRFAEGAGRHGEGSQPLT
jgi:enoyl-CoA hydratase